MYRIGKIVLVLFLGVLFGTAPLFAEPTPIPSLYQYRLDNGLTLFVAENHTVPLTYIEIAVKCGAFTQNEKNAGLFHLYEHMMFKGNSLYHDAASVTRALSRLGVAEWNGSTGLECVNYFFTVPSAYTKEGLEFWNAAIRFPLLDKKELSNEKKVVLAEIQGNFKNPSRIIFSAKCKALFKNAPYTMDTSGSPFAVENATVRQLKEIQKKYYIPNNSAVFVGGDVEPDEVFAFVKEIFGSWQPGKDPFKTGIRRHDVSPFSECVKFVMPCDNISPQLAQFNVTFRGPDAAFDEDDTYSADVLSGEILNPAGVFMMSFLEDGYIGIPDTNYLWGGYNTSRQGGMFSFVCNVTSPEEEIADRAVYFTERLPFVLKKAADISSEDIRRTVRKINDWAVYENETAAGLLSSMRFWWICAGEDYYYNYPGKISLVTSSDLKFFVAKYFEGKYPLVTVLVNPDVYEKTKMQFEKSGFAEITAQNAFWFLK